LLITLAVGTYVYFFQWNKPHRQVQAEVASVKTDADALLEAYTQSEEKANQKYLNKVIQVKGKVGEITENQSKQTVIFLQTQDPMSAISCTFQTKPTQSPKAGDDLTIKGLCTGFTTDVVLIQCSIL
jgi:tRNA_anti-like